MALNTWLIAGVAVNDHIVEAGKSCWNRQDLMNIPELLRYDSVKEDAMYLYRNNIGVVIMLFPYGRFQTQDAMEKDYYSDDEKNKYSKAYKNALAILNKNVGNCSISDFDWVMPIIEGDSEIEQNYCKVPVVAEDNKEYVSLIDCSMIYSSVRLMSDFMHAICDKKSLSRYQRWQLTYYQRILQTIETPSVFLTNKEEIELFNSYYRIWDITDSIKVTLNNAIQTVSLFSFISDYEKNNDNDLFSTFLTFFGIVVGLEAIYNLISALFSDLGDAFRYSIIIIIALTAIVFAYVFAKKTIHRFQEKREFNKKTKK